MNKGDRVIATKNIGGVLRESVPKGSEGVVTQAGGWGSETKVLFTISGLMGDRKVEVRVESGEVA